MTGEWPPLETDWPKTYSTTDDYQLDHDGIPVYVKTVNPAETHQRARPLEDPFIVDDGARLDTPANHRRKALESMRRRVDEAERAALLARDWARSFGYHPEVVDKLSDAIQTIGESADLINTFEGEL